MSEGLLEKVRKANNLPSLPNVAVEILRLAKAEDVSVEELAAVIQTDPALTVKMLKVVNSTLFGIPRQISSVRQAVSMLGLRSVKVMALSFSLVSALGSAHAEGFDFQLYWRRSLSCAAASRLLGKAVAPPLAEEAFVAGLLTDLGMVASWRCASEMYEPVLRAWTKRERPLAEIESDLLGITHARLGRELLETWGLPESLCNAVGAHHGEGLASLSGKPLKLAKIIHSAAAVADLFCQEIPSCELDRVKRQCLEETGIDEDALEEILDKLDEHVCETSRMLSVQVGETVNYAQIQAEAAVQLAQLSLQAEMERAESSRKEEEARMEANQLHKEKKAILEFASMDGLTKVANRAAFDKRLAEEVAHARKEGCTLSLILMDVDHFKKFNDTYGHQAGDQVLRNVAACMRDVVQSKGFVARYGGEEFAVILVGKSARSVCDLAEEIRRAIETHEVEYEGRALRRVTVSLGAVCWEPHCSPLTSEEVIEEADKNLYWAKRNGRNRVEMGLLDPLSSS